MTPEEFKQARQTLGLTQAELGRVLRYSPDRAGQSISDIERDQSTPLPQTVELMRAFLAGYRTADWPEKKKPPRR